MAGGNTVSLRSQIVEAMGEVGITLTPDVLSKCLGIASSHRITPSQMAESWEAHSLNKNLTELSLDSFPAYRAALLRDAESSSLSVTEHDPNNSAVVPRPGLGKRQAGTGMVTPPAPKRPTTPSAKTSTSAVDMVATRISMSPTKTPPVPRTPLYGERMRVGDVVSTYNPRNLSQCDSSSRGGRRCTIDASFNTNVQDMYRCMFTPLEERAKALDDRLVEMGEVLRDVYDIGTEKNEETGKEDSGIAPLEAVGIPRQDLVCCIGRICNEAHEGKINRTSLVLEGSRHHSNGARINLDLSSLTEKTTSEPNQSSSSSSYSLFPGQIIAVEGRNPSGRKLVANRICEGAAHPLPKTPASDLLRFHHDADNQNGKPLTIMTFVGPFTTSDNLEYEPLLDALNIVKSDNPDVVILVGPFVDVNHPMISKGEVVVELEDGDTMDVNYETLFAAKVAGLLEVLYEEEDQEVGVARTQVVLVPSLDDANSESVYPQPPLADRLPKGGMTLEQIPGADGATEFGTLGLGHVETAGSQSKANPKMKRVHCVSNPATLRINELVVGVTSTDSLLHISTDETNANLPPGSRITRLAQHLIQQRSYYPLFPPPVNAGMRVNMDLSHVKQWSMPTRPDLLIVPSKLATFARDVMDGTVVVNPGKLSRGTTGGTYGILEVHPMKREMLEGAGEGVELAHAVSDRIRVEINRI